MVALNGMLGSPQLRRDLLSEEGWKRRLSEEAYELADAMLAARDA